MISEKIGIDQIDCRIMDLIQKAPNLTHTEIATHVNRSQPTVGMRIKKLENLGVLKNQAGINIKTAELILGFVELDTLNPKLIEKLVESCPYMINGFRKSGNFNYTILIVGDTLQQIDQIINTHFRNNLNINRVILNIVTNIVNDFVLSINFNSKECENSCTKDCCGKF